MDRFSMEDYYLTPVVVDRFSMEDYRRRPKRPVVYKYPHQNGWVYFFIEGTGHRLAYDRQEDWIEIVW